jgi:hypothetical protein
VSGVDENNVDVVRVHEIATRQGGAVYQTHIRFCPPLL